MKKITLMFLMGVLWTWAAVAQVTIGPQDGTTPTVPIQGNYGYSYTQQLIYQSEINAFGDITSISFYLDGVNNTSNSNDWTVYLGTTSKTAFTSDSDWVPFANLSQVYSGTVTFPEASNQMVISFDADFTYDNTDNLVVAVHESQSGYDFGISFGKTASFDVDRSIYYRSDSTNPDPASPPADPGFSGGTLDYINNVILGGIQQSCPNPSGFASSNVTTTSVDIGWTENGSSSSWEVVYGATGFNPLTDGTTVPASNDPEISLSGLTHSTSYEFYVKAICDVSDESTLTGPESFTTLCNPIDSLPYTEEFDIYGTGSDAFPSCWIRPVTYTGSGTVWPSIVAHSSAPSSPNSLKFQSEEDVPTYAVSPAFAEDIQDLRVSFMLRREGTSSGTMDIGVMSDPLDVDTFELIQTIEPEDNNYISYVFNLNAITLAGGNNHIALRHNSGLNNWFYWVDDFVVEPIPSCLEPSDLTLASTAETTADISWTLGDAETSWNISWGTPGYTPGDGDEINNASVSTESYQITGLTANTHYDVYVQAHCNVGDESIWVGPLAVFTGYCIPTTTGSSAYIDGFTATGDSDQDIENIDTGSSLDGDGYSDYSNLPALKVYASSEVDFTVDINGTNTTGLRIWVDWDQDLVFGDQDSGEEVYASTGYEGTHAGSFIVPTDAVGIYRFRVGASYTPGGGPADPCTLSSSGEYEDYMIEVLALDNCADATAGTLVTQDMGVCAGNSFTLEVEGDSDAAEGLTKQWMSSADGTVWDVITGATSSSYTVLDGIEEETQFKYVVSCTYDTSTQETAVVTISLNPGSECYCEPVHSSTSTTNDYITSISSEEAVLDINYAASSRSVGYIDETATVLKVYAGQEIVLNTAYIGGQQTMGVWVDWNNDGSFGGSNNPDERLALSYGGSPQSFDIEIPNTIDNGEYRLRVRGVWGNKVSDGDDFSCNTQTYGTTVDFTLKIVEAPSCTAPSDLAVSGITDETAFISWTEGSTETEWEVKYGASDFDPSTDGTLASASINPELTIDDLDASTTYDVYVRAVCDVDSESDWVGPESFTTLCGSLDMPWNEDFESGTANSDIVPNLACWSQEYVVEQNDWKFVTANGNSTVSPHSGSLMAEFRVANFNDPATKLITPAMDLTSLSNAQLTFYFANVTWGSDVDQLRVYYKKSASDLSWTLIDGAEYTSSHLDWEEVVIILPEADDATDYLIAFEATSSYARGVNLDDISIGEASILCDAVTDVVVSDIAETTATVNWTGSATATEGYTVNVYETGTTTTAVFTDTLAVGSTTVEVIGLTSETDYDVYVVSDCGSGVVASSDVVTFTTEAAMSCDAVTDVVVSDITVTTATVSWAASVGAVDGYIVEVYVAGSEIVSFSDVVAAGVTTIDLTELIPDTAYDVYVISNCGSGETSTSDVITFTTEPTTNVGDFDVIKLTVYPNPVSTDLNISAAKVIEEIQVYNILGQRVMTQKANNSEVTLDVTELPTATYMLKVSVDGVINTVRFVKK